MDKSLSNVSVTGEVSPKLAGIAPGNERFAFLYVVIAAGAVASAMTYSGIAALPWWKSLLMAVGALIIGCAILYSILEVRRLAQTPQEAAKAREEAENPYHARTLVVDPPTKDPYPHHEDYTQSAGFDQGQLTSRIQDETPLFDRFLHRKPAEAEKTPG